MFTYFYTTIWPLFWANFLYNIMYFPASTVLGSINFWQKFTFELDQSEIKVKNKHFIWKRLVLIGSLFVTCERMLVEHSEEREYKCEAVVIIRMVAVSAPLRLTTGKCLVQHHVPVLTPVWVTWNISGVNVINNSWDVEKFIVVELIRPTVFKNKHLQSILCVTTQQIMT